MFIKYDLIGAFKSGIRNHPQADVEERGFVVIKYEGCSIGDCIYMEVKNTGQIKVPEYIKILEKSQIPYPYLQ